MNLSSAQHEKKLTVAIPTYNRKEYLLDCLTCLDVQVYKNFDVIIFDNSSDYSVSEFISLFPKLSLRIDRNEENIGNLANFKKIIKYNFASPYVMIFHDDDTLNPIYFEKTMNFLESHPNAVWAGSNIRFIKNGTPENMKKFSSHFPEETFTELNESELVTEILSGFNLGFGSIIYRSESLKKVQIRTEEFDKWFDRPLMIDLVKDKTAGVSRGMFMNYRMHQNQDSQTKEPLKLNNLINLFSYYKSKVGDNNPRKFKVWATNNSINVATQGAKRLSEFTESLKIFKQKGFFKFGHVGVKGAYYLIKFMFKLSKKWLISSD